MPFHIEFLYDMIVKGMPFQIIHVYFKGHTPFVFVQCPSMPCQIAFLYDMILKGMPFQMPFQIIHVYLKGHLKGHALQYYIIQKGNLKGH